jgi:hypothetical protein
MDMVLLDWTRMGKVYCLAGAVVGSNPVRIVRPLHVNHRAALMRNVGWSAFLINGHARWEIFELIGAEEAPPEPPHLEDVWVRAMRPRRQSATLAERRAILEATTVPIGQPLFGESLTLSKSSAHLTPGTGTRSLATLQVPAEGIRFSASWREGAPEPDVRVALGISPLGTRLLPLKDHHLRLRAEKSSANLTALVRALDAAVDEMGDQVAVRLGLSRPFQNDTGRDLRACWLMTNGIFSWADPQA